MWFLQTEMYLVPGLRVPGDLTKSPTKYPIHGTATRKRTATALSSSPMHMGNSLCPWPHIHWDRGQWQNRILPNPPTNAIQSLPQAEGNRNLRMGKRGSINWDGAQGTGGKGVGSFRPGSQNHGDSGGRRVESSVSWYSKSQCMLHCPIHLHLYNTNSKITFIRISQSINS